MGLMKLKVPRIILADENLTSLKLMEVYIKGFLQTCEVVPCASDKKVMEAVRNYSAGYPDYLIANLYVSDLHGLELLHKVKDYFLQQYNCRPPFPIILLLDCCNFQKACLDPSLLPEHSCIQRSMMITGVQNTFSSLPVDGCMFKPIDKERLMGLFDQKWPEIQNTKAFIRMQTNQRFVFRKKKKDLHRQEK